MQWSSFSQTTARCHRFNSLSARWYYDSPKKSLDLGHRLRWGLVIIKSLPKTVLPTLSWPIGKGIIVVTTATRVQFTVRETVYNAWVPDKEVKPPFLFTFYQKKKNSKAKESLKQDVAKKESSIPKFALERLMSN